MAAEPLGRAEFVAELRALENQFWHKHPFHIRLHAGELDQRDVRLWVVNRWYYQHCLPRKDAGIVASCPIAEVRRAWLARIMYHDGTQTREGGAERWLRLAEAVGVPREEVLDERDLLPGVRFAVDAYVTFTRTRPWLEGVAAGLTELFAPGLMRRRVADMRVHYPWIAEDGFDYFTSRIEITPAEGSATLDLVLEHARTREQQLACVAALAFKCDVLRAVLDALDYATLAGRP